MTLVVFAGGRTFYIYFFICERKCNVVRARVVTAHSFAIVYPLCPSQSFFSDHRKNVSTCCEAVMMDWSLFPTHFNELKLWGVLLVANSKPAQHVGYGASRLVAVHREQDMQVCILKQQRVASEPQLISVVSLRFCFHAN